MNRIFKVSKLTLALPLIAVFCGSNYAEAGELIGSIQSRNSGGGSYGYGGSMTSAQRLVGNPVEPKSPFLIESSYHGANYYAYNVALSNYKQNLRSRELQMRTGAHSVSMINASYECGGNAAWCQQEMINRGSYSTNSNVRLVSANYNSRTVASNRVRERAVSPRPTDQAKRVADVSTNKIPTVDFARSISQQQKEAETTTAEDLSLLSKPSKNAPSVASEDSKKSIWSHFQKALTSH